MRKNSRNAYESEQTKSAYETALALLQSEIEELERRKVLFNLNPNFESDLDKLNRVKYQVNLTSSEIGRLELRKDLISEAQKEIQSGVSTIDLQQLQQIYQQATSLVSRIQKTFHELHDFHNRMVESKIRFIAQDLPKIDAKLAVQREHLNRLLVEEAELSTAITQSDSFDVLEQLITELNAKYQTKGEYENTLRQLSAVESKLTELTKELAAIDNDLFSDEFALKIKEQVNKFNRHFSSVSYELYGEKYALKFDPKIVKGRRLYEFTAFNTNFSSGKNRVKYPVLISPTRSLPMKRIFHACTFSSMTKRIDARQSTPDDCQSCQRKGDTVCCINFERQAAGGIE